MGTRRIWWLIGLHWLGILLLKKARRNGLIECIHSTFVAPVAAVYRKCSWLFAVEVLGQNRSCCSLTCTIRVRRASYDPVYQEEYCHARNALKEALLKKYHAILVPQDHGERRGQSNLICQVIQDDSRACQRTAMIDNSQGRQIWVKSGPEFRSLNTNCGPETSITLIFLWFFYLII